MHHQQVIFVVCYNAQYWLHLYIKTYKHLNSEHKSKEGVGEVQLLDLIKFLVEEYAFK